MLYNGQKLQISYLDHIVQLLKDCRHDEAADAAEEEAEGEEELRGGGGRGQLVEDGGGEERGGRGHEVHHEGHHHPVQVQPELLLQEVLTRVLSHRAATLHHPHLHSTLTTHLEQLLLIHGHSDRVEGRHDSKDNGHGGDVVAPVAGQQISCGQGSHTIQLSANFSTLSAYTKFSHHNTEDDEEGAHKL